VSTLLLGIVLLALMNLAFKAVGPALLGNRSLPEPAERVLRATGPGLLASLVVVTLLGSRWSVFDATILPGLALAIGLRSLGQSHPVCALAAVMVTGAVRLVA